MAQELPNMIRAQLQEQTDDLLRRGRRVNFKYLRQRRFWSRYLFAPGKGGFIEPGEYPLFSTIEGGKGQGYNSALTLRETNWPQVSKLSSQQNLVVKRLGVRIMRGPQDLTCYDPDILQSIDPFIPLHPQDCAAVAYGMVLAAKYITELVPQGYLADFPIAGGVFGFNQSSRQTPGSVFGVAAPGVAGTPNLTGGQNPQVVQGYGKHPIAANQVLAAWERKYQVPLMISHSEQFNMALIVNQPIPFVGAGPLEQSSGIFRVGTGTCEVEVSLLCTESYDEQS